jgi:4,4'-diaponeurosporenoate glycosyltransferase
MLPALVASGLALGTWYLARLRRLDGNRDAAVRADVRVSVVVPARDEGDRLGVLLGSLQQQIRSPDEVIVVDDASSDDTADVAKSFGARVLRISGPPPGWHGKPWACHLGATIARGTHVLFLDADTWLAPDALTRLLAAHDARGGLISVQPFHVVERPYESYSAYPNALSMLGSGAFTPRSRRATRVAFGPCLLTTAVDYERVGGHAAVRTAVAEDVRLARHYDRCGLPVSCFAGGATVRFRMYPRGSRELVEGWTKNLATGAVDADRWAVAAGVVWVTAHLAVATAALSQSIAWIASGAPLPVAAFAGWALVALQLDWVLRRIGSFPRWTAVCFPVPLAGFLAIFARSLTRTFVHRRVTWSGRALSLDRAGPI